MKSDARFGRAFAERTGYVPTSIVAVPLVDEESTIGVLQVLDKRDETSFSLRDVELASVFARQAAIAISASRVERDTATLLVEVARRATNGGDGSGAATGSGTAGSDALVAAAAAELARGDRSGLWALVDSVARLRRADSSQLALVSDLLGVLADHAERQARARRPRSRTPRGRRRAHGHGRVGGDAQAVDLDLPAWSDPFVGERRSALTGPRPFRDVDRDWAWGGATGAGQIVAVIDSGIEVTHPAVGGKVRRSVRVELGEEEPQVVDDPEASDVVGHGTACAGIIHGLAPDAEFLSVRVLGPDNRGKGAAFAAGLEWAIEQGASVVNLSLSSKSEALFAVFHELATPPTSRTSCSSVRPTTCPGPSYPSLFAAVVSVAAHDVADPWTFFYNPAPPVEFGAYGRRRRCRLAGRQPDHRDRQQLRRAARGRPRDAHPAKHPKRPRSR